MVFPYVGRKFTFFSRPRSLESDAFSHNMGCLLVLNDEKSGANVSRHVASRVEMNMRNASKNSIFITLSSMGLRFRRRNTV